SMPKVGAQQEAPPIVLSDPKGKMPPRRSDGIDLRIGADEANDLRPRSEFISQFHALIFSRADRWFVRDLSSKNGTFLNETRVAEAELTLPATVRVGDVSWQVDRPDDDVISANHGGIIGDSAPMRELFAKIAKFSPTKGAVLITGESGTGKELVAH